MASPTYHFVKKQDAKKETRVIRRVIRRFGRAGRDSAEAVASDRASTFPLNLWSSPIETS